MRRILPFFAALLLCSSIAHPFYLGVTEARYSATEKKLQITVKLFTNDLEDALKASGIRADLINGKAADITPVLEAYLKKHFHISVNASPLAMHFLGFEHEGEAVWMYLEADCPLPVTLSVHNRLLYDLIRNQSHIIHCEVGGVKKSLRLSCPEALASFSF